MYERQKDEEIGQDLEKLACACIQSYIYVPFESNTYTRMIVCVHTNALLPIHEMCVCHVYTLSRLML